MRLGGIIYVRYYLDTQTLLSPHFTVIDMIVSAVTWSCVAPYKESKKPC